jgi:hypothetical protein
VINSAPGHHLKLPPSALGRQARRGFHEKSFAGSQKAQSYTFHVHSRSQLNCRPSHRVPSFPSKLSGTDWLRRTTAMPPALYLHPFFSESWRSTLGTNSVGPVARKIWHRFGGWLNQVLPWPKNWILTLVDSAPGQHWILKPLRPRWGFCFCGLVTGCFLTYLVVAKLNFNA